MVAVEMKPMAAMAVMTVEVVTAAVEEMAAVVEAETSQSANPKPPSSLASKSQHLNASMRRRT